VFVSQTAIARENLLEGERETVWENAKENWTALGYEQLLTDCVID
jgi:hypothetical protein